MTLVHMAPQVPLPDRLYQGRVQLLEVKENRSWTAAPTASVLNLTSISVTRRETGVTLSTTGPSPERS